MANDLNILPDDEGLIPAPINSEVLPTDDQLVSGLPPNQGGVTSAVDAATLGQFTPAGQQGVPDSDVAFIQRQIDPLGGDPIALSDATQAMFTPGANVPLRVGGTSGQLTGSRDIFVAGSTAVPFALMERRRAAQQQAAQKRAEDLGRFKIKKPKLSKDPRFNKNLVDTTNEFTDIFIKRATDQFGSREAGLAALQNPGTKIGREFIQQMDNLEILAGEVDQIVDLNAEVEQAVEEGDQFVSDETLKLHNEFKSLTGAFEGGDAFGAASFRDKLTDLQTSQSVDQFFKDNDVLKNIEGEILQTAGITDAGDSFRQTTRFTKDFEKGARAQAKSMKQNVSFRNRDITEDEIFDRIMALKGKTDKRTASVKTKPQPRGGFSEKPQDINDRIRNIETMQKAFFNPDGTIGDTANEESQKVVRTLVGGKIPGEGSITSADFVKGKDGKPDTIQLQVSSGTGRNKKTKAVDLDMTDPGTFVELNGIMNTSPSESLKIKNESFRGQGRRTDKPDTPTNVVKVTRQQIQEKARELSSRGNRVTEEDVIKSIEEQGKQLDISE